MIGPYQVTFEIYMLDMASHYGVGNPFTRQEGFSPKNPKVCLTVDHRLGGSSSVSVSVSVSVSASASSKVWGRIKSNDDRSQPFGPPMQDDTDINGLWWTKLAWAMQVARKPSKF